MEQAVVVGVDGSAHSDGAVDWAACAAALRGLRLRLVHVAPPEDGAGADAAPATPWPHQPPWPHQSHRPGTLPRVVEVRLTGDPVAALAAEAESAAMLVVGARGAGGHARPAPGSVARGVARTARCPVVLVPGAQGGGDRIHGNPPPGEVALGVDARDPSQTAIEFAFDAAERTGSRLHAVHAWRLPSAAEKSVFTVPEEDRGRWEDQEVQLLSDALRAWRHKYPAVSVLEDVVLFDPAHALARASTRADLLVVGRRGTGLGPAVSAALHAARCPVAVAPSRT